MGDRLVRWGLPRAANTVPYLMGFITAAVATVLVTRSILALAGYPQLRGGGLHVAHVLWGGLLLRLGVMLLLSQFELWNDGRDIPVFAWRLRAGHTENWNLYHLSDRLRMRGWLVPAYSLPDGLQDLTVQRIVVRNGLSRDLAERFLADLKTEVAFLDKVPGPIPTEGQTAGFHH